MASYRDDEKYEIGVNKLNVIIFVLRKNDFLFGGGC